MSLEVDVYCNGVPVTERWLNVSEGEIRELVSEIVWRGAQAIAELAKGKVPVKTGRLQASIRPVRYGEISVVQATAPYALFVEKGHTTQSGSYVEGVFFLRDAAWMVIPQIGMEITEEVNNYLRTRGT